MEIVSAQPALRPDISRELVQTVPRCAGDSIALRFRAGHCVQAQPALRSPGWVEIISAQPALRPDISRELVQTVPRCAGDSIALRFRAGHCVQAQPALRSPGWVEIISAQPALRPDISRELVQPALRPGTRCTPTPLALFTGSLLRPSPDRLSASRQDGRNVLTRTFRSPVFLSGSLFSGSLFRLSRAAQVIQSLSASARAIACRLSLPPGCIDTQSLFVRFPYYTESGHQNQHICLIFSNMCSILEPRALERRQIAAKLADRQSVHAGFGEDPGFCYHAGLPLLLEYKKLCPIIRTVPKFFPGVSSGTLGWRKKSGKIRCLSFLSRASRGF